MRALGILAVLLVSFASANIKTKLDPSQAVKLRKGEIIRYFRRSGGHSGHRLFQAIIIVREDRSVMVKTTDFETVFKMNEAQRRDFKETMSYFDIKRLKTGPRKAKTLPSAEEGGIDMFLTLKKGKRTYTWDNVRWQGGFAPIIDSLEVYQYLARPEGK